MADETRDVRAADEHHLAPDPVIEVYKRDVERSLLRENLRRTVDERVRRMISALRLATALGEAGRAERHQR